MRFSGLFALTIICSSPLASGEFLRKEGRTKREHSSTSLRTGRMRQAALEVHNMNAFASEVMSVVRKAGHELKEAFEDKPVAKVEHVKETPHVEMKIASQKSLTAKVSKTATPASMVGRNASIEHKIATASRDPKVAHKIPDVVRTSLKEQQDVLTKLFAKLKTNIGDVNKGEKENKAENEKYLKADEAKLERDQAQLKDPKTTAHEREILVNRTRMDEEQVRYWKKGRELQHGMFHANLKIAHGLMSRVKSVLDAYSTAFAKGKLDKEAKGKLEKALGGMPHALIETRRELRMHRREYRRHSRSGHRRFKGFRLRL